MSVPHNALPVLPSDDELWARFDEFEQHPQDHRLQPEARLEAAHHNLIQRERAFRDIVKWVRIARYDLAESAVSRWCTANQMAHQEVEFAKDLARDGAFDLSPYQSQEPHTGPELAP
jgi:hypothetical protein